MRSWQRRPQGFLHEPSAPWPDQRSAGRFRQADVIMLPSLAAVPL